MTKLVTDPGEVKRLAEEREEENWAFRNWIKMEFGFDDERLMSVVRELADEITAGTDCTQSPPAQRLPRPQYQSYPGYTCLCPIVFNVAEEMKYALRWPRRDRWRR